MTAPTMYPDIDALKAVQRGPGATVDVIRAELFRQAEIVIPLYKQAGRLEEWQFWAHLVAFAKIDAENAAKKRRRSR